MVNSSSPLKGSDQNLQGLFRIRSRRGTSFHNAPREMVQKLKRKRWLGGGEYWRNGLEWKILILLWYRHLTMHRKKMALRMLSFFKNDFCFNLKTCEVVNIFEGLYFFKNNFFFFFSSLRVFFKSDFCSVLFLFLFWKGEFQKGENSFNLQEKLVRASHLLEILQRIWGNFDGMKYGKGNSFQIIWFST